jgi:ATP-dependent helicase HrpB
VQRAQQLADRWIARIKRISLEKTERIPLQRVEQLGLDDQVSLLLALALPLSIARRRPGDTERYLLASGSGAVLQMKDPLQTSEYLVVCQQQETGRDAKIVLAARLNAALFEGPLKELIGEKVSSHFDEERGALVATKRKQLGDIIISEQSHLPLDPEEQRTALLAWLSTPQGFARLPLSEATTRWRCRVAFARKHIGNTLPDLSDEALAQGIEAWLGPFLHAPFRLSSLSSELVEEALRCLLDFSQQRELAALAPESFTLPSGKERRLDYSNPDEVVLAATIQELFGVTTNPAIGRGQFAITVHLLSPARRPVQVTRDLAGFWRGAYQAVRRELRGRYPKHRWPEDPLTKADSEDDK